MALNDYPHAVDVLAVEDLATDRRMGRLDDRAVVATAVRCRVNEMPVERVEAFGREETRHTHRIHFKRDPAVGVRHLIRWTPPSQAVALTFAVKGTRRPRLAGLPWVVFAERHAAGDETT